MKRLTILLLLVLSACSALGGTEAADRAVTRFHASYDGSQFEQIYTASHPVLKTTNNQAQFLEFMQAVRRKLGKVKSTSRVSAGTNMGTAGTRVMVTYETEFEEGAGVEQFFWQVRGDSASLLGYNINSPTLVTK